MSGVLQESVAASMRSKHRARRVIGAGDGGDGRGSRALAAAAPTSQARCPRDAVAAGDPDRAPRWRIQGVLRLPGGRSGTVVEGVRRRVTLPPEDPPGRLDSGIARHRADSDRRGRRPRDLRRVSIGDPRGADR